ncbi:MAG: hypothetical protein KAQ71_02415 [Desulfobulbaceae bacterium]|nr:hypothetical protein [Desulfobulbaceae bacterium]
MEKMLLLLASLPVATFFITKMSKLKYKWLYTGVAFGLVIAPVSLALIKFTFIPVIGKLIGGIGLITNLIHGSVGYFILMTVGFMEPGGTLSASQMVTINLVNAAIWSTYYGILGYNIDTGQTAIIPETKSTEFQKRAVPVERRFA